jgi:hypothetical protein
MCLNMHIFLQTKGMPQDGTDTSSSAPSSDSTTPTTDTTSTPTADTTTTTTTEAPKTWPVDLVNFPAQGICKLTIFIQILS